MTRPRTIRAYPLGTELFQQRDMHRVFAHADDRNVPVQRLFERLGFRCDARLVEADWLRVEAEFAEDRHEAYSEPRDMSRDVKAWLLRVSLSSKVGWHGCRHTHQARGSHRGAVRPGT